MPEWIDRKRMNWPTGSKQRALKGKSAIEALNEKLKESPTGTMLAKLNDRDLALVLAGKLIKEMHQLGTRRATRKTNRECDT